MWGIEVPIFDTKKELCDWCDSQEELDSLLDGKGWCLTGTYYLSHGEYNRPHYYPRRYKDGWSLHGEFYFYSGTFGAPKDGRIDYIR